MTTQELQDITKNIKITVEIINPDTASAYLEMNTSNRPLSSNHTTRLVKSAREGQWQFNGSTIVFADDGRLVDGQHRLRACVISRVPMVTLVVRGVSFKAFETLGDVKQRTKSETLAVCGEHNYSVLSSAILALEKYTKHPESTRVYSSVEMLKILEDNPGLRDSVNLCIKFRKLYSPQIMAVFHYVFGRIDKCASDEFVKLLLNGGGMIAGHPIFILRERLIRDRAATTKLPEIAVAAMIIMTWNNWRKGINGKPLTFRRTATHTTAFPVIYR